jgi:hypothetical protein
MAISAKFIANFDSFVSSTKNAEASLKNLETGGARLGTSFDTLKSGALSLAGAFGIAFSVEAVTRFVGSVFDAASGIHDMSLKLGISAEAVQGFKFAAEQAGSSLDTVGTAINKMNANLADGDKGTVGALKAAGLEFQKIRSMKSEDAFLAITDAIEKIPDPMTRAQVTLALFGKSGAELLPAIVEGFRGAADGASKMSNDTITSLEKGQDAWEELGHVVTTATGGMIAKMFEFTNTLREQNFGLGLFGVATVKVAKDIELLPPVLHKTAEELRLEAKALADSEKAAKDAAEAMAKWTTAAGELYDAGRSVHGTLNTINGSVVEAIKFYLEAGVSQTSLATAYGLTSAQINAVVASLKEEAESAKVAIEASKKAAEEAKAWAATLEAVRVGTQTLEQRIDSIDGAVVVWASDLLKSGVDAQTVATYYGLTGDQIKAVAQETARWAAETAAAAASVAPDFLVIGHAAGEAAAGTDKVTAAVQRTTTAIQLLVPALFSYADAYRAAGLFVNDAGRYNPLAARDTSALLKPIAVQGFAGGVENFSGGPAWVGERGPELLNLPRGSSITPTGAGDVNVVQHFYVNGTGADVARIAMAELSRTMKVGRKWPAA